MIDFYSCSLYVVRIDVACTKADAYEVLDTLHQYFPPFGGTYGWAAGTLTALAGTDTENESLDQQVENLREQLPGRRVAVRAHCITQNEGWAEVFLPPQKHLIDLTVERLLAHDDRAVQPLLDAFKLTQNYWFAYGSSHALRAYVDSGDAEGTRNYLLEFLRRARRIAGPGEWRDAFDEVLRTVPEVSASRVENVSAAGPAPVRDGAELLRLWMMREGRTARYIADCLQIYRDGNVDAALVTRWHVGVEVPNSDHRASLDRLTDGAVPAASWEVA